MDPFDEVPLRELVPAVIGVLVRRGAGFAAAEDAVQEALVEALRTWPADPPRDPKGWLVTVAWRRFLDVVRSEAARERREVAVEVEPAAGPARDADDTLEVFFLCAHPALTPASAVALTLRAVAGLTTRQVAEAYLVPEATMAQRISRAKRTVAEASFDRPGDLATVRRVLYLVFNEGYSGDVDLAAEAIRLARQLAALVDDPENDGLLALMLLHHARRPARIRADGTLVPLAEQDRTLWDARPHPGGRAGPPVRAGAGPPRRAPAPGRDRGPPRRRRDRRGDRLGAGRAVVRRAAGADGQPGRTPQPGRRRR